MNLPGCGLIKHEGCYDSWRNKNWATAEGVTEVCASVYHSIALCIYIGIFVAAAVDLSQTWEAYNDLFMSNWAATALAMIHLTNLFLIILLWRGNKRFSTKILLTWLIIFVLLMATQLGIIFADRSSYFLAQIPLVFIELYCAWVVWELRAHLLFMLTTRAEIPMMTLIRLDHPTHCMDRADGEVPDEETDSSFQRFGYHVFTSTACGYSRVPREALEVALGGPSAPGTFRSYYRTCFCPLRPYHSSHELFVGTATGRPPSVAPSRSSAAITNREEQRAAGGRLIEVVSRVGRRYTGRRRG